MEHLLNPIRLGFVLLCLGSLWNFPVLAGPNDAAVAAEAVLPGDWVEAYIADLTEKGKGEQTKRAYRHDLESFYRYIRERQIREITPDVMRDYIHSLRGALSTKARIFSTLSQYFKFGVRTFRIVQNPLENVLRPQGESAPPKTLTLEQVHSLLDDSRGGDFQSLRDRAMLTLLYVPALKVSEVVQLNVEDVDLVNKTVTIKAKGKKKARTLSLELEGFDLVERLSAYLEALKGVPLKEAGDTQESRAFFPNKFLDRLTERSVRKVIKTRAKRVGLDLTVQESSSIFRHSRATHMLAAGISLERVQGFLGLKNKSSAVKLYECKRPLEPAQ